MLPEAIPRRGMASRIIYTIPDRFNERSKKGAFRLLMRATGNAKRLVAVLCTAMQDGNSPLHSGVLIEEAP